MNVEHRKKEVLFLYCVGCICFEIHQDSFVLFHYCLYIFSFHSYRMILVCSIGEGTATSLQKRKISRFTPSERSRLKSICEAVSFCRDWRG